MHLHCVCADFQSEVRLHSESLNQGTTSAFLHPALPHPHPLFIGLDCIPWRDLPLPFVLHAIMRYVCVCEWGGGPVYTTRPQLCSVTAMPRFSPARQTQPHSVLGDARWQPVSTGVVWNHVWLKLTYPWIGSCVCNCDL